MISTKGRYALRLLLDLASQDSEEYIPLRTIAQRQNISEKYLNGLNWYVILGNKQSLSRASVVKKVATASRESHRSIP